MNGILLVNKPSDWTSFDVVAYVRKIIATEQKIKPSQIKVGHSGTLDPLATGLLVLLTGKQFTRLAPEFTKLDKEYVVGIKLGEVTDSGDRETEPTFYSSREPSQKEVDQSLKTLTGKIMQLPPIYSAIKVDGQRAYKMARQGKEVKLEPRPVNIYSLKLVSYDYPNMKLVAKVSSGTYIRSLVVDLGKDLKTGAYMTDLKRTEVGDFKLEDAVEVKDLDYNKLSSHLLFV